MKFTHEGPMEELENILRIAGHSRTMGVITELAVSTGFNNTLTVAVPSLFFHHSVPEEKKLAFQRQVAEMVKEVAQRVNTAAAELFGDGVRTTHQMVEAHNAMVKAARQSLGLPDEPPASAEK